MALQMVRPTSAFTKVMRGYDPDEVDEHLREVEEEATELQAALEAATTRAERLEAETAALRQRLGALESTVRTETPRSLSAIGERLLLVLSETERDAALGLDAATAEAAAIVEAARTEAATLLAAARADAAFTTDRATASAHELEVAAERWAEQRRDEVQSWEREVRAGIDEQRERAAIEFAGIKLVWQRELDDLRGQRDTLLGQLEAVASAVHSTVVAGRSEPVVGEARPVVDVPQAPLDGPDGALDVHDASDDVTHDVVDAEPAAPHVELFDAEAEDATAPLDLRSDVTAEA